MVALHSVRIALSAGQSRCKFGCQCANAMCPAREARCNKTRQKQQHVEHRTRGRPSNAILLRDRFRATCSVATVAGQAWFARREICSELIHSFSFDHRRRPETLRTAMATAFFCPTRITKRFPRVTPV